MESERKNGKKSKVGRNDDGDLGGGGVTVIGLAAVAKCTRHPKLPDFGKQRFLGG